MSIKLIKEPEYVMPWLRNDGDTIFSNNKIITFLLEFYDLFCKKMVALKGLSTFPYIRSNISDIKRHVYRYYA